MKSRFSYVNSFEYDLTTPEVGRTHLSGYKIAIKNIPFVLFYFNSIDDYATVCILS